MEKVKLLLGLGYWVQGFRCFPWLAMSYFLKDGLRVPPSSLQLLQNSANIPMVGKPFFGLLSDALPLRGQRRVPYLAIGALLQAVSWFAIALLPSSFTTIPIITLLLIFSNLGASVAEVANDAIVAEAGRDAQSPSGSGQLQSFVWMASSSAGAIGNLIGGLAVSRLSPRVMFLLFGLLLLLQLVATISVPESSLNLPKRPKESSKTSSIQGQLSEVSFALHKPEMLHAIAWFSASYAVTPILLGTMFFYQTQQLNLDSSVIGLSKVFGQASILVWSVAYNSTLKGIAVRKILSALQVTIVLFMVSDMLFVKGFYRGMGISDSAYVILFSGLLEALFMFKMLPFTVLMAHLCPAGYEGSVMAFVMSAVALASIISAYFGVALSRAVGISESNFEKLPTAILIQAAFTVLPLFWSSWIPDAVKPAKKPAKKKA